MNLKAISNDKLLSELKLKVESERKLPMEILFALREIETRRLHLEIGYADLYTFAVKELGYSAGAAYRRISAMRLLQAVPEVAPKLESGELGLENASQAQSFFRKENQRRKEQGETKLSLDEKQEVITELLGKSTREGHRVLMDRAPNVMMPVEKTRPLPERKTLVQFVAPAELMEKLEELKHLLAHKNFEGRMDLLIDQMADLALSKLKPKSSPQSISQPAARSMPKLAMPKLESEPPNKVPSQITPAPGTGINKRMSKTVSNPLNIKRRSRYIPSAEKRKVLLRDQNGCTFRDPKSERICQSRHGLQFDHIVPFSRGGQNTAEQTHLR